MSNNSIYAIKTIGAALMLAAAASPALARPDTRTMSCAQTQALVDQRGAIVLSTGRNTYARFVRGHGYCDAGERFLHPAFAATSDRQECRIGFTCQSWSLYFSDEDAQF